MTKYRYCTEDAFIAARCSDGQNLICGVHYWDYLYDTGIGEYHNEERLEKFTTWVEDDRILIDEEEILRWEKYNLQPYKRDEYQGAYQDIHGTPEEPYVNYIRSPRDPRFVQGGASRSGGYDGGSAEPASAVGRPAIRYRATSQIPAVG